MGKKKKKNIYSKTRNMVALEMCLTKRNEVFTSKKYKKDKHKKDWSKDVD